LETLRNVPLFISNVQIRVTTTTITEAKLKYFCF
jgi:hypothetical protein